MKREIKSATLDGRICKYSYVDTLAERDNDGRPIIKKGTETMNTTAHEDLHKAFRDIIPHFVLLSEQLIETKEIRNAIHDGIPDVIIDTTSIFYPYSVDSFKLGGTEENESVSFSGNRILTSGGVLKLTTPPIRLTDLQYDFIQELIEAVEFLKEETYQYTQGKQAPPPPDPQEAIDFDAHDLYVAGATDAEDTPL
jgi:hypothetical protein